MPATKSLLVIRLVDARGEGVGVEESDIELVEADAGNDIEKGIADGRWPTPIPILSSYRNL
jgi:hypothetical protein